MAKEGCVVWLTGLPGSGKTTIARLVEGQVRSLGMPIEMLDGDEVGKNLSPELGFSTCDISSFDCRKDSGKYEIRPQIIASLAVKQA